jgi:hypothetical protein
MARWQRIALVVLATAVLSACDSGDQEVAGTEDVAAAGEPAEGGVSSPAAGPTEAAAFDAVIEMRILSEDFRAVLVDEALVADPRDLEAIGRYYCEGMNVCRTSIWFDEEFYPNDVPVPVENTQFAVYGFGRNAIIDYEASQWNCNFFPQFEETRQCLPRPF